MIEKGRVVICSKLVFVIDILYQNGMIGKKKLSTRTIKLAFPISMRDRPSTAAVITSHCVMLSGNE